jgi:hypothetical protein
VVAAAAVVVVAAAAVVVVAAAAAVVVVAAGMVVDVESEALPPESEEHPTAINENATIGIAVKPRTTDPFGLCRAN